MIAIFKIYIAALILIFHNNIYIILCVSCNFVLYAAAHLGQDTLATEIFVSMQL